MLFQLYTPNTHKSLLSFNDILITLLIMYYTTIFMFCILKKKPNDVIKEVIKEVPVKIIKEKYVEVIKEIIKEVIKEVPVEVIKEVPVEIIKEVRVEIIKEVPVEVIHQVESIRYFKEYENIKELLNQIDKIYINNSEMNNIKKYYTEHYGSAINNYINPSSYVIYCIMIELLDKEINIKDKLKKETILIAKKANFLDNEILKDFYTKYENNFNKILNCM